jgi:hypothetical protein
VLNVAEYAKDKYVYNTARPALLRTAVPHPQSPFTTHLLGHILRGVKHRIHRVDVSKVHEAAVRQLAAGIKLAAAEAGLKDVEGGHLRW